MKQTKQMSETLLIGILLALVGGFLDAYTYLTRGGVFANAQTGNMVLFGINLSKGNITQSLSYLIPIVSFFIGILIAEMIKSRYKAKNNIHWRQIIIIMECIALCIVFFIPAAGDMSANAIVSFVCSLQVESFRKVNGNPYASTMCTGNLRSATEQLYYYRKNKDKTALHNSMQYFSVIAFFIVGACIGTILSDIYFHKAVLFGVFLLIIVGVLMNNNKNKK